MTFDSAISRTRPGIHLLAPIVQMNPFPTYSTMRLNHPICQIEPDGIWAISRYESVRYALKHHELFSSAAILKLYQPEWLQEDSRRDYSIFSQDPP
jgi:cytochrome P450